MKTSGVDGEMYLKWHLNPHPYTLLNTPARAFLYKPLGSRLSQTSIGICIGDKTLTERLSTHGESVVKQIPHTSTHLHVDLDELPGQEALSDLLPVRPVGGDEAREGDDTSVSKQLGYLTYAPA